MIIPDASSTKPREGGASFSLTSRIERAWWNIVWALLGSWTPPPLNAWRCLLVRVFGGDIARTAKIYGGVHIWLPRNLKMEGFACLGTGVECYCMAKVTLGPYAIVSQRAHLCAGTHDIDDPEFQLVARPILLEANAWVAAEAFIGPGVTMKEGAVLGARAVTFHDLDAWTVYAGNPAVAIRSRKVVYPGRRE